MPENKPRIKTIHKLKLIVQINTLFKNWLQKLQICRDSAHFIFPCIKATQKYLDRIHKSKIVYRVIHIELICESLKYNNNNKKKTYMKRNLA